MAGKPLPPPPDWLVRIPLAGPRLAAGWERLSSDGLASQELAPYVSRVVRFLAAQARSFGLMVVELLVTVIVAGVLYGTGERAGLGVRRFFRRLAGQRGDGAVVLAGKAIRAVALGVMVTALTQTVLSFAGLAIAGVPHVGLLTALILMLCVAQLGPALILIPTVIWLYASGSAGAGTFMLIWSIAPITIDNFMRPYLIKRGAQLPLWLVFVGVVGGLIAFGVIGLFIGPVILAVTYTLMQDWVDDLGPEPVASAPEGRRVAGLGEAP
jgi:predicted PurR-regulated permease PerM